MIDSALSLKEGWLKKRSREGKVMTNWRRRYFRLFRNELLYFHTPQDTVERRRYELTLDTEVLQTNDQGYPICFVLKAAPGVPDCYLQAESDSEKNDWVSAIFNAARRTADVAQPTQAPATEAPEPAASVTPSDTQPPPAPKSPPARILFNVTVQEARNLHAADLNGKSDPYCIVAFVGKTGQIVRTEEKRTNYLTGTLNPEWKAPFTLGHKVDLRSVEAVQFELWDHDNIGRDNSLGSVRIPLSSFRVSAASMGQSETVDGWFRVEPPQLNTRVQMSRVLENREHEHVTKDYGDLHLIMNISGPNLVDIFHTSSAAFVPQSRVVTAGIEHTDNRLEVRVLAAKGLISADLNDSSDPFCELTLLNDHGVAIRGEKFTTEVKYRTRNPCWENEHHVFGMVCPIEQASKLKVRVLDHDKHSRNDPLGFVLLDLDQLAACKQTEWYTLQPEGTMEIRENLGEIQLQVSLIGESRGERARRMKIDKEVTKKAHEQSVEQLELENAQLQLHDAACKLDGARIPCAAEDYQARHPRFYGINGCIHHLNTQIPRAHREKKTTDEGFQARSGLEGQALLEVTVVGTTDLKKKDVLISPNPYAVIEVDPAVCIEECKRTSAPLSPTKSKRIAALNQAAAESRNTMFSKRAQAEVSSHRAKLTKNEVRSERSLPHDPDRPVLKVEILSGHGLSPTDRGGYSDPYCTLSITDRTTGKPFENEKKRTAVISRTLNPEWKNESFAFGNNSPLSDAGTLLIHVKDHNNIGRSTPLGRVQIPLHELCRASVESTSITSKATEKRYPLTPEPWMKNHASELGELCIKTEVVGNATVLSEMMQRLPSNSPEKMLSFLSFSSFSSEGNLQSESQQELSMALSDPSAVEFEDEKTEIVELGAPIRTSAAVGSAAAWRKEKFSLSLSYPGMFSDTKYANVEHYTLHLRVHSARKLLGPSGTSSSVGIASQVGVNGNSANQHVGHSRMGTNPYFTVVPVLHDGKVAEPELKQSLTVYGTCNPCWPEEEFVFGKIKDISNVSYLSLHVYSRDLRDDEKKPISELLSTQESQQDVRLRRFQLHMVSPSGEVDDNGLDVLQYGQRVMAFRRCQDGGRFYPARVQQYIPFPHDEYVVRFESGIESIEDLRDLFSLDVKGKIESLRSDGRVDVSIDASQLAEEIAQTSSAHFTASAQLSQLTPLNDYTKEVEMVMARHFDEEKEEASYWKKLKHTLSGIKLSVLSATNLPNESKRPGCLITMLGDPKQSQPWSVDPIGFTDQGELMAKPSMASSRWQAGQRLQFAIPFSDATPKAQDVHFFERNSFVLGFVDPTPEGDEQDGNAGLEKELEEGVHILDYAASILIRVVDQGDDREPLARHQTIGFVKIDLATLEHGAQNLHLKVIPPEEKKVPYYKFAGSLFLHVTCSDVSKQRHDGNLAHLVDSSVAGAGTSREGLHKVWYTNCGLTTWYKNQLEIDIKAAAATDHSQKVTRIERRQMLRSSLTPMENTQVDALHTVLVIIMKRIVSIMREIKQFEDFEALSPADMVKCRQVHTVNTDQNSEWIGRTMSELPLETRKDIVVHLEMELLDIAAIDIPRVYPSADMSREKWVELRTARQKALQAKSGFIMQDRTSALVLQYPSSFTGEGMIAWIQRSPAVLWKDQWTKYCSDSAVRSSCLLNWGDPALEFDSDAIQAPSTREYTQQWLSALCVAGFIEDVTPLGATHLGIGKKHVMMDDKADRFYRLREVEIWMTKLSQDKRLFPLDLVQEVDCYRGASTTPASASVSTNASMEVKLCDDSEALHTSIRNKTYAKKLSDHCDGFLGMQTALSNFLLSPEVKKSSLLKPVADKTQQLVNESLLWDWKYCLFVPPHRCLYLYHSETAAAPMALIDMTSSACRAAYNFVYDTKGGWMDIVNANVLVREPNSEKFSPISAEMREKMLKTRENDDEVIEFKTREAQRWIQAFARAGVHVDMRKGQMVLMKRLNPAVLQRKCIEYTTEFDSHDLEGSFHRLLNSFFEHHKKSTHQEHENKLRTLRAKMRSEMKKPCAVGETAMAYFGKGQSLNPKPTNPRNFTVGALYSSRIIRIRTPYTDTKYPFKALYDRTNKKEVPTALEALLVNYGVTDKTSWLSLPIAQRDLFLLYDVEYRHANEIVIEEGLLREHLRANEGDLEPRKVRDKCTDLNLIFKPNDLEDCITRMVMHHNRRKPLGYLKIPTKMVSPHRVMDAWYPLGPANDMVQKDKLGQVRVQLRLVQTKKLLRSERTPALLEDVKNVTSKQLLARIPSVSKHMQTFKNMFTAKPKRTGALPSGAPIVAQEQTFVKISILEGRKLLIADTRTSDPYVKILLLSGDLEKEHNTLMKTDVKTKTLNPKWQNQEFVLGKSENTIVSNKRAVLLRVMDHDQIGKDDSLGCVKIEFQRSKSGHIAGLVLVQADPNGEPVSEEMHLDEKNRVEVEAMLLADVNGGQSKSASAKKNSPAEDGKLGKLRFAVELLNNDNYVDPNAFANPAEMASATKKLETKFSAEVVIKSARVVRKDVVSKMVSDSSSFDWHQYTCTFLPHGEGGLRIQYDASMEDLALGNPHTLEDLLRLAESLRTPGAAGSSAGSDVFSSAHEAAFKVLGRTFDVSKVAYFDVRLVSDSLGKVFEGKFGQSGALLKNPELGASFPDEVIVLKDRDNSNLEVHLTVDLNLIGILRAERLKRVLSDSFRLVGLAFDAQTMNQSSGRNDPSQFQNDVQDFLWGTCRTNVFPGRNVAEELLAQVRCMSQASKLHWRVTPQLLSYVFEIVFAGGEKDRLTFANSVALDGVLDRWSQVLIHMSEAKSQLVGHLHGKETPRLIQVLFSECDWTGFEFSSLESSNLESSSMQRRVLEVQSELRAGDRVNALLPFYKHPGVAVDICLSNGKFVAGTIIGECGDGCYDVGFCAGAKVRDEGDEYVSDDEELPPLLLGETVFVCPLASEAANSTTASCNSDTSHRSEKKPGRIGTVEQYDEKQHPEAPYLVLYTDQQDPRQEWRTRVCLDSMHSRVRGSDMKIQLRKEDYVRVMGVSTISEESVSVAPSPPASHAGDKSDVMLRSDSSRVGPVRPGKIVRNYGNARYEVAYLDGQSPQSEAIVTRDRLLPLVERILYGGTITRVYEEAEASDTLSYLAVRTTKYDVLLLNGELAEGLIRSQLRLQEEHFAPDAALLGAVFSSSLVVHDTQANGNDKPSAEMATKLSQLWGNDQIVKVYAMLPMGVASIQVRDATTNKLVQTKLMERNETRPRFLDQYHGFIKGENLSKTETTKLRELYATSCIRRSNSSNVSAAVKEAEAFSQENCFCVLLAPSPRVEIHGTITVSSLPSSEALFKTLLTILLAKPTTFVHLFQRLLRAECSVNLPLNRKERLVIIQGAEVSFYNKPARNVELSILTSTCSGQLEGGKATSRTGMSNVPLRHVAIDIKFQLSIPHNDRGSLADAVIIASQDAAEILTRLVEIDSLDLENNAHFSSVSREGVEQGLWTFEDSKKKPKGPSKSRLAVELMDRHGKKGSDPTLSLELLPLDDVRLSALDIGGSVHELRFPMDKILVETNLRRHLSPFIEAKVVDGPHYLETQHVQQQQINRRGRRDSLMLTTPTMMLKTSRLKDGDTMPPFYGLQFTDKKMEKRANTSNKNTVRVPQSEIKFDSLRVQVQEASQLCLKEQTGSGNLLVEILLVSSDFQPQLVSDRAATTPFGLVLSTTGEIYKDMQSTSYPENSTFSLVQSATKTTWVADKKVPASVTFQYPAIDLQRVSGVKINLLEAKTKTQIGTTTIPMSQIAKHSSTSGEKGADVIPQNFSVQREENGRLRVVGKISLRIERSQSFGTGDVVYAKRLENEANAWCISPFELLATTLNQQEDKLTRGLLVSGPAVLCGGKTLLQDSIEQELQLQKIANVMMISHAMKLIYSTKTPPAMPSGPESKVTGAKSDLDVSIEQLSSIALDQLRHTLQYTKWFVEDTASELGLQRYTTWKRLPWSSDLIPKDDNRGNREDLVVVDPNIATSAQRLRRTILKLHHMYLHRLIPTLQRLYELDAMGDYINVAAGEQLLTFFEEEVEDLEVEDQEVYRRVYQRLRLVKMAQVLEDIMRTTVRVKVMDQDPSIGDDLVGVAFIPLLDLLDQQQHDNMYQLSLPRGTITATNSSLQNANRALGNFIGTVGATVNAQTTMGKPDKQSSSGKVRLRLQLTFSESSFLEQATQVYKIMKAKYIAQHEAARRCINAAVVPAQRRRWMTTKGYLDELKSQADGKLHWERTPVLLNLVWDIFSSHEGSMSPSRKNVLGSTDEKEHAQSLAQKSDEYRNIVVQVHTRWTNLQPKLEELVAIQAATQIHAKRTPELLEEIEREVEGLDVGLSTAWQQVNDKWTKLLSALNELVEMENNKLHLGRAPELLHQVSQRCSKGLSNRHAEAVANVQFRWMAITQPDGPLCELRLMEKKGLHWRRTHELVLLLNEQCEGFADVDANTLEIVEKRWEQLQEWLDDVVLMQSQHAIDCEVTPFILKKMNLLEPSLVPRVGDTKKLGDKLLRTGPISPKVKEEFRFLSRGASGIQTDGDAAKTSMSGNSSPVMIRQSSSVSDSTIAEIVEDDVGRLEGIAEWYAIEEARYELERIPYHRITTDSDRSNWLAYSHNGKDTRLVITQEEMVFSAENVRVALEDRGVIPKTSNFDPTSGASASRKATVGSTLTSTAWVSPSATAVPGANSKTMTLSKEVLKEIAELERTLESCPGNGLPKQSVANPERVAELYTTIESLGKTDLLWKVDHAVNTNRELEVPVNFVKLLDEMKLRQISTTEMENLARALTVALQKEALAKVGVAVPISANYTTVLGLMHRHQVKDVMLPSDTATIQSLLQERGMDRKGEPVLLRGIRIGTQASSNGDSFMGTPNTSGSVSLSKSKTTTSPTKPGTLNTGLGIIDTQVELLRKSFLLEALRKRNSLVRTFPGESRVLDEEDDDGTATAAGTLAAMEAENTEVDLSGDYMTLVERFQHLLVHESYTKRLAQYAALDRCMRALLHVPRDQIVTKEDIALTLHNLNNRDAEGGNGSKNYRLPLEAFTREELLAAAQDGAIRQPSEEMLARCPRGKNASAMAHYAAVVYAANVFQEATSFRSRVDPVSQQLQDAFPFEERSSVDGAAIPKDRSNMTLRQSVVDWLLGSEASIMRVQRRLSAGRRQRLLWASAAFTLRNRWLQRSSGWCDGALEGVGVEKLLQRLLLFETANKMHMVQTEALLREVRDKCSNLRAREKNAQEVLETRFQSNKELLEQLVTHAERCLNDRKLHSEDTPALLHALEQVCIVPSSLNPRHREAYHVVTSHWLPHRQRLAELVQMHKEGTFSMSRTPELLGGMAFHTEGLAGSSAKVATDSEASGASEDEQGFMDRKLDEIRRGQRKLPSNLHLDLGVTDNEGTESDNSATNWKELSPSKRMTQPLSPHEKTTSWKLLAKAVTANSSFTEGSSSSSVSNLAAIELTSKTEGHRRKSSLGDELKLLLRSPTKWLMNELPGQGQVAEPKIRPEHFFPQAVSLQSDKTTTAGPTQ